MSDNKIHISDKIINDLISAKIITDRLCDRKKAQHIIREYLCRVHLEAVNATVIACTRQKYVEAPFND